MTAITIPRQPHSEWLARVRSVGLGLGGRGVLGLGLGRSSVSAAAVPSSGMVAWWKIDTISASDGDLISAWSDSSGYGNTLSQTLTARPTYKTSQIGIYGALRFDGSNDCMATTGQMACRTLFIVSKIATLGNSLYVIDLRANVVNGYLYDGPDAFGANWTDLRVNGVSKTKAFANFASGGWNVTCIRGFSAATSAFRLMRYYNSEIATHSGDIAEILVYADALSDGDLQQTEAYLLAKYGI